MAECFRFRTVSLVRMDNICMVVGGNSRMIREYRKQAILCKM